MITSLKQNRIYHYRLSLRDHEYIIISYEYSAPHLLPYFLI